MAKTTAIYARISRDRDGTALGVARQEADCRALCEQRGWHNVDLYVDNDLSAYTQRRRRPAYERMLEAIEAGSVGRVVAWHPDRLHRSLAELERFIGIIEANKCAVVTVTEGHYDLSTVGGRMTARILGSVARAESEHKSERIARKHVELAAAGRPSGGGVRGYGYERTVDAAGHITAVSVVAAEAKIIRELMDRFLGGEPLVSLARDLNRRGVPTVQKTEWTPETVRGILRSARISGQREHRGRITGKADWAPIVTPAETERARAIIDARKTGRAPRSYVLTGLVRCAKCGATMSSSARGDGNRSYNCVAGPGRRGCGHNSILADPVETIVVEAVLGAADTDQLRHVDQAGHEPGDVVAVLAEAKQQLNELADTYGRRVISMSEWLAARKPIEARIAEANQALADTQADATITRITTRPGLLRRQWAGYDIAQQHTIVAAIIDHVEIGPARRGTNSFDPGRVALRWRA